MHKEPAFDSFRRNTEFEISLSPQLASYLFGFACHFMLTAPPRVCGRFEKQTESLMRRSTELDRYLR